MSAKYIFAAIGILLAILSFVISGGTALLAGAIISVGVSVLVP